MGTKNFVEVLRQIKSLLEMLYQIRFGGGTSKRGDKNTTIIPIMIDSYKTLFVNIVPYELNANIEKDESNYDWSDENFEDLTLRKLKEEIGYSAVKSDLVFISEHKVKDNRYKDHYVPHTKRVYLVEKFKGKLLDRNNGSLLKNETHNPLWVPARVLPNFLFEGHLESFEKLIDFLYKGNRLNKKDYYSMKEAITIRKVFGSTKNKKKYNMVGANQ